MVAPPPGTVHKPAPPMPKRLRKIVQIAAAQCPDASYPHLFALCDDGTAWQMLDYKSHWEPLPEIPQSE